MWATVTLSAAPVGPSLIQAVKQRDARTVHALLRARAAVNEPEADGTTALHWAVRADDVEMVRVLIGAGADVKVVNRYGVAPLGLAAVNGSAPAMEELLKAGADANTVSPEGETVLMTAARTGQPAAVKLLLAHGAKVNATEGWRGETALMWAAAEDHPAVIKLLIEGGADINARSRLLEYPEVRYNLATHATPVYPRGGLTALMFASRQDALESVRALADSGADLNVRDPDGTTALMLAIVNTHYDLAAVLVEKGADLNVGDRAGMTALYAAIDLHTVESNPMRKAPRKSASRLGSLDVAQLLLEYGADPDVRLKTATLRWGRNRGGGDGALGEGATPLMRAARFGDVAAMRLLLDEGADLNLRQKNQTTALMLAAGVGWRTGDGGLGGTDYGAESDAIEAVKLCLEGGADVNVSNDNGETALHAAVVRGPGVVKFLAEHGAKMDAKDKSGRTPLDIALGVPAVGGRGGRNAARGPVREAAVAVLQQLSHQ
jgi:ankyrin repeat protein